MGVLNALQRSPGALTRNPVLVVPAFVIGSFQLPQLLLQASYPLLASSVSLGISLLLILVMPFFQSGTVGMADEALDGRTRLGTFLADGKAHYVNVLVAYLLLLAIGVVVGGVIFVAAIVGGIFVLPHVELPGVALGLVGLFFLLFVLPFLIFAFFIQFYAQAIVLDDEEAASGIKRSYALVRQNLLSTLGYTVIAGVVGSTVSLGFGGFSMLASPTPTQSVALPQLSFPALAAVALAVVVIGSVIGSFLTVFSVSFYRDIRS